MGNKLNSLLAVFFFLLIGVASVFAQNDHYTVIISLDGFRWDYTKMYHTPFLDRLAQEGVQAEMQPSFPSKTFPNHYTLATGLVPDHHGLIANKFYDRASGLTYSIGDSATKFNPRFYGGEPVWVTAQRQGLKTGVVYWPGSDVAVKGMYPTYYKVYDTRSLLTFPERVAEVEHLLELPSEKRPRLVMAYFEEPDHSGHVYGPASAETRSAVERMDCLLEMLYNDLRALPYGDKINFIVTADHGMTHTSSERILNILPLLNPKWYTRISQDLPTLVFARKGCEAKIKKALSHVPHIRVWEKKEVPAYLHYGSNPNVGEIVVLPDVGWVISDRRKVSPGNHGYDPTYSDMHALFRASGPDFKKGYTRSGVFVNTSIYPLLCRLLGITPSKNDGSLGTVKDMLK